MHHNVSVRVVLLSLFTCCALGCSVGPGLTLELEEPAELYVGGELVGVLPSGTRVRHVASMAEGFTRVEVTMNIEGGVAVAADRRDDGAPMRLVSIEGPASSPTTYPGLVTALLARSICGD